MSRLPLTLCLALLGLSSAGCSSSWRPAFLPAPKIEVVRDLIPDDLLDCGPEPLAPAEEPWPSNAEFEEYVVELRLYALCGRVKLESIRERQGRAP